MSISPRLEWLAEDERNNRRSIADTVNVLERSGVLRPSPHLVLWIRPLLHLFGRTAYLVNLQFKAKSDLIFGVSLPTAIRCWAIVSQSSLTTEVELDELDEATVDLNADVLLRDGRVLRAVNFEPANLPYNPTTLEWRVIRAVARIQNAEARCFPRLVDKLPIEVRDAFRDDFRTPDCQAISQLQVPPLKVLRHQLAEIDPELALSSQKLADTLAIFGVRPVIPRPRRAALRRNSALV